MAKKQLAADAAPTTTPTTDTVTIADYDDAVAQGKAIVAGIDDAWWNLCALADAVETRWGEKDMERFFDDVGVGCVGPRRLSVYRAYKGDISAPGPKCSYSVARSLQTHPERAEHIRAKPAMSKAEADAIMKTYRNDADPEEPEGDEEDEEAPKKSRPKKKPKGYWKATQADRWFREVLTDANTASAAAAEVIKHANSVAAPNAQAEPALRKVLRETIRGHEKLFPALEQNIKASLEAAEKQQLLLDFFKQLVSEDEDEAEEAPGVANGHDKAFYAAATQTGEAATAPTAAARSALAPTSA
jgi:hypothetical protein